MNKKQHLWNRLLAAFLIVALLMVQITPAFAVELEENPETTVIATEPSTRNAC
ncbi:MAG: hypothetical protein ACOX7N_02035 [Lawsonibacter sp.]|jgi:hypothetical protein